MGTSIMWLMLAVCVLQTLYAGSSLDDNQWHTVHIKRRARRVELRVDRQRTSKGKFQSLFLRVALYSHAVCIISDKGIVFL